MKAVEALEGVRLVVADKVGHPSLLAERPGKRMAKHKSRALSTSLSQRSHSCPLLETVIPLHDIVIHLKHCCACQLTLPIYQHVSLVQVKGLCVGLAGNFDVRSWPLFSFAMALMLLLDVQCVAAQLCF